MAGILRHIDHLDAIGNNFVIRGSPEFQENIRRANAEEDSLTPTWKYLV